MKYILSIVVLIGLFANFATAQSVTALKTDDPIKLDGILDEPAWADAEKISGLTQFVPRYNEPSPYLTEAWVVYDNRAIYVAMKCYDTDMSKLSNQVTRRDGNVSGDDAVSIILDTFNDGINAHMFVTNPIAVQLDEMWSENGSKRDAKWDTKWDVATSINYDNWIVEFRIPFESLSYDKSISTWGLGIFRGVPRDQEMSFWAKDLTTFYQLNEYGKVTGLDLSNVLF